MKKVIHLSLARKSVPILMDVVQSATAPSIEFVLDDYTPPSNARARIYIKKEGGEVYNNCTLSGNVVTYTPTAGSFDVAGQCVAQLELVQGSTVAVSWRIFVTVEPNLIDGSAAPASTEYGALTQLIVNAQRYDGIIGANNITGYNNRQGWIALTSGQDLNTVTAPGVYYASSSVASTLLNCPWATSIKLMVESSYHSANYIKQTITSASVSDEAKTLVRKYNGSTWSDWAVQPLRSEVNAIANRGGKNLLPHLVNTKTENGITFTRNADGSVTVNGTATAQANYIVDSAYNPSYATGTSLIVSGCPTGGSASTYRMLTIRGGGTTVANDIGEGATFTTATNQTYRTQIIVYGGTTVTDLTFYPMIRDASIQDDTYVPYGMSNAALTKALTETQLPRTTLTSGDALTWMNDLHTQQANLTFYKTLIDVSADSLGEDIPGGSYLVEGVKISAAYGWQRITHETTSAAGEGTLRYSRSMISGTWCFWGTENSVVRLTDIGSLLNSNLPSGNYYVSGAISDVPAGRSGWLEVRTVFNSDKVLKWRETNNAQRYFVNIKTGGTWTGWYRYEGTAV